MLKILLICLLLLVGLLGLASFLITKNIERQFPPIGDFLTLKGAKVHFVDVPARSSDAETVVFVHGAGGNLRDPMAVYRDRLSPDFRLIFLDRPGQGYSEAFENSYDPKEQARTIKDLLDELGIESAIVVGHSFGGVVAGAFGVLFPERTAGLVFLAPVSHPWGTGVDWTYDLGNTPVAGWLFTRLLVPIAGTFMYEGAIKRVFAPNPVPEKYNELSGTKLAMRPHTYHNNSRDVARVDTHVDAFHDRYQEIKAPTVIFHGDRDDIVSLPIHSINGLSKDIAGSKLIVLEGVGHKPDYVAVDQVAEEIRAIANSR